MKPCFSNKIIGQRCEAIALQYFQENHYQLVAKNTRFYGVEIDLLLKKDQTYYMVEVKSNNVWRLEKPLTKKQTERLQAASSYFSEENQCSTRLMLALVTRSTKKTQIYSLDD